MPIVEECSIPDCRVTGRMRRGMCSRHYLCWHRTGDPVAATRVHHGLSNTVEYRIWTGIKDRCLNINNPAYDRYGGRAVAICPEWATSFQQFLAYVGPRPDGTSLDRIDNDGNYEPGNVRWATPVEQGSNKRNNRLLAHDGLTLSVSEWARRVGINRTTITARLNRGASPGEALCLR